MRIVSEIKSYLNTLKNNGYIKQSLYTYAAQFNNIAGRCDTPIGVLLTPQEWRLECDTVTAREHGIFRVYFLTLQKEMDFDATLNEALIDDMIDIAVVFVGMLKNNPKLEIEDIDISTKSMYDANDRNMTGVELALRLKEKQGRCIPTHNICD